MTSNSASDGAAVVGTWKLLTVEFEREDTGEHFDLLGPHPEGRIVFTANRRMITVLTGSGRTAPKEPADAAALLQSMMAYSGPFRIEDGNKMVITVDLAWHPAWVGTEQIRFFKLDSDILSLRSGLQTHPAISGKGYGVVTWRREA